MSSKVNPSDNRMGDDLSPAMGPEIRTRKNCKGLKLHSKYWNPNEKQIKGLVFICHGFGEHLMCYEELALKLVAIGVLAFGHDHVGHGKSEGTRGHINDAEEYITDVLDHCEEIKNRYCGKPCFIIGHSMGGMIAIRAATIRPIFDGVVLVAPLIQPNPEEATLFKLCVAKALASLLPLISVGTLNLHHVTRDKEMIIQMTKDNLRYHGGFRARWAIACYDQLAPMQKSLEKINWPFLILHGLEDRLCSSDASQLFYKNARSDDKKIKFFPGAYHHLYMEIPEIRQEAMDDTVDWIRPRLSKDFTDVEPNS